MKQVEIFSECVGWEGKGLSASMWILKGMGFVYTSIKTSKWIYLAGWPREVISV